jgi:hypothetical protein
MSCLSQEIVDYLNTSGNRGLGEWLEETPVVRNFVTCPYISIRPTAMPRARRITAFEGQHGRYIDIHYRDGSHHYIINVAAWDLTVEHVEAFIQSMDRIMGTCHVERSFLLLSVPAGYTLKITGVGSKRRLQLHAHEFADIGLD